MNKKCLLSLCAIVLILYVMYQEITYIQQFVENHVNGRPSAAVTLSSNVKKELHRSLQMIPAEEGPFTFIDFGCAEGNVLAEVYRQKHAHINSYVGVELEKQLTDIAQKRFAKNDMVQIYNMDMKEYTYADTPTILFIYEPLWELETPLAQTIYLDILSNIPTTNPSFYIIYVSGVLKKHMNVAFFDRLHFRKLRHAKCNRVLGLKHNSIYLFKQTIQR